MLRQLITFQTNLFSILHFVCDPDEAENDDVHDERTLWIFHEVFFFLAVDAHTSTTARVAETKLQAVFGQVDTSSSTKLTTLSIVVVD